MNIRILDPHGVLQEGEIHFKSSKNLKDPIDDCNPNILLGDVLVGSISAKRSHCLIHIRARSTAILVDYPRTSGRRAQRLFSFA